METGSGVAKQPTGLIDSLNGKTRALRVSDVATLLNISERMVYQLSKEGLLPTIRISGCIRFDPAALARWLQQISEKLSDKS